MSSENTDGLTPAARLFWDIVCGAWLITLIVYSACMAGTLAGDLLMYHGRGLSAWGLITKINFGLGDLLTASVAFVALMVAYKEYRIRNCPAFYGHVEVSQPLEHETIYQFSVVSVFEKLVLLHTIIDPQLPSNVSVKVLRQDEVLLPAKTAYVATFVFDPRTLKGGETIKIRCRGQSSVNLGASTQLTVECALRPLPPREDGASSPIRSYKLEPEAGLLSILR